MRVGSNWRLGGVANAVCFLRNQSGQTAILFGIILVPLLVVVGFALDFNRQVSADRHLEIAADIASLSGARAMEDATLTDAEIQDIATRAYHAQLKTTHGDVACADPTVTVDRVNHTVSVSGDCSLNTVFGDEISGQSTMAVTGDAAAKVNMTRLDLSLAIDLSESMQAGTRMADLKSAAKLFVSELLDSHTGGRVRIALVPYGTSINAHIYGNRAMGRLDHDDSFGDGADIVCIRERTGLEAETDAAPLPGQRIPELLNPGFRCPRDGIVPLSSNEDALHAAIDSFTAQSGQFTSGHLGVAWSWFAISPNWNSIWPSASAPAAYDDRETLKATIYMTDGFSNRVYDSSPFLPHSTELVSGVCEGMRDEGILVYAVGFGLDTSLGAGMLNPENALRDCAGGDDRFYSAASGAELEQVYLNIASQLKGTRLAY